MNTHKKDNERRTPANQLANLSLILSNFFQSAYLELCLLHLEYAMNSLRKLNVNFFTQVRTLASYPAASLLPTADVEARVIGVVKQFRQVPPTVTVDMNLISDLKFDSLSQKELADSLAAEFCLPGSSQSFSTVKAAVDFYASQPKAR